METKQIKVFVLVIVIIVAVSLCYLSYRYFFASRLNNYLVENKYYGFTIKTPKNWVAEKNISFSDEELSRIFNECQNNTADEAVPYEVGAFRFKDQKFLEGFEYSINQSGNYPSGAILNITVSCVPTKIKEKLADYGYGNLEIGGEKALSGVLNFIGSEKAKYLSLMHGNLQYRFNEYVYISPDDKGANEDRIRKNYEDEFNKIISSIKFVK